MNAVDHNNVVIFDDRGIHSIMCRFVRPKDTEEVPAVFKIGDKVADAIYISKYPNIVIDGRAYSMPMADPTVNITFDGAVQACRCKGLFSSASFHLSTHFHFRTFAESIPKASAISVFFIKPSESKKSCFAFSLFSSFCLAKSKPPFVCFPGFRLSVLSESSHFCKFNFYNTKRQQDLTIKSCCPASLFILVLYYIKSGNSGQSLMQNLF